MKFFHILSCLILTGPGFSEGLVAQETAAGSEADRDVKLVQARVLLADFKKAVDTDDEKADEAFAAFLEMPEFVQQGFGRYLDAEWEARFLQFRRAAGFPDDSPAGGSSISADNRNEAREHRSLLAEIRVMADEDEMKSVLKSKGYPALEALLRIFKSSGRSRPAGDASSGGDPSFPAKQVAALRIGKYRHKLHSHFGVPLPETPEQQLGLAEEEPQAESEDGDDSEASMVLSAADRRVLQKNDELFAKIERPEAEGIRQLNEWRIAAGLNPLEVDPLLCDAARDHSKDMADRGFFDHTSPVEGKTTLSDRARNFGTSARAENIAINGSAESANLAWFYSPGHHKNMFGNHTIVGLGNHGRHYTQMFR